MQKQHRGERKTPSRSYKMIMVSGKKERIWTSSLLVILTLFSAANQMGSMEIVENIERKVTQSIWKD